MKNVKKQCDVLIVSLFKSKYLVPPPNNTKWNYIINISSKWYRNYFYFISTYYCPSPNALSKTFESKFTRLEYIGEDKFALSYMCHTEQWRELFRDIPLNECLKQIKNMIHFHP